MFISGRVPLLLILLLNAPALANAATITVAWDANTESDLAGYVLEYGTSAGVYSSSIDVGRTISYSVPSLTPGTRYYFAVRAYNTFGETSDRSTEVSDVAAEAPPPPPPSGTGLVAAYGFEEGAGALAGDASGHANHATISGAIWHDAGRFGKALSFDGIDDWVTIADAESLDLTSGLTLEAWVYPTAAADGTVIAKESPGGLAYALYSYDNAPLPVAYLNIGSYWTATGTTALPLGTWSHMTVTYDGTTLRLFINGSLVGSRVVGSSVVTSAGALRLGGNSVWGEFFQGFIDEVRIYDRALSEVEIAADMSAAVVPAAADTGLVAAFGFEEGTGSLAGDSSGHANHGTIAGAVWHNTGRFGKALKLDGVDDWVTIADSAALDLSTGLTLEAWVYPTAAVDGTVIVKESADGLAYGLYSYDNAPFPVSYLNVDGYWTAAGTATLPLTTWTHLATTYDGTTLRLYVNGTLVSSRAVAGSLLTSAGVVRLGGNSLWGEFFQGRIDEVRIYNRALSAGEIAADMTTPVSKLLVLELGFDEGSGTVTADTSGRGRLGTVDGATWTAAGRHGGALQFDGVDDVVRVAHTDDLNFSNALTIEAWVYPTGPLTGWRTAVFKETSGMDAYSLYAHSATAGPRGQAVISGVKQTTATGTSIPVEAWTHVAVTYNGAALRVFVNGIQVSTTPATGPVGSSAGVLSVGGNTIWGEYFEGVIDEVRVYRRALTASELQADMNKPIR